MVNVLEIKSQSWEVHGSYYDPEKRYRPNFVALVVAESARRALEICADKIAGLAVSQIVKRGERIVLVDIAGEEG